MLLFAGSVLTVLSVAAQDAVPKTGECWVDGDFDNRTAVTLSDGWQAEIDVSNLCEGLHTIGFRASDSKGRWSSSIVRYFMRTARSLDGNIPAKYEYWIDGNFSGSVAGNVEDDGSVAVEITPKDLCAGLHNIALRASDSKGLWSSSIVRYFIVPEPLFEGNEPKTMLYWIDNDIDAAHIIDVAGGIADLDIDMSALSVGIHTITCEAIDTRGHSGAPVTRYFLRGGYQFENNAIGSYAYWFNCGSKVYKDVTPSNPFVLTDLWIDIEDVVPNEITEGYRFDTAAETVFCDDNVFFGFEAYDLAGQPTQAVLSDTFAMTVPVKPLFTDLTDGVEVQFDAPADGYICGFRMNASPGDSLVWTVSDGCVADVYAADGSRLEWRVADIETEDGRHVYGMRASSALTYVLVHHSSPVFSKHNISCTVDRSSDVEVPILGDLSYSIERNCLTVSTSEARTICVTGITGVTAYRGYVSAGTSRISLNSGVYIVNIGGVVIKKIIIP